jgi:DNA-binding CsgD family transcriptional regulator
MGENQTDANEVRVAPLEAQWPALRFLGLGAWWAWIWMCYTSPVVMNLFSAENQTQHVFAMYLISTVSIAVSMLVISLSWRKWTAIIARRGFVIGSGVVATIATFLVEMSGFIGSEPLFFAMAAVTGLSTSVLCLRGGQFYGSVGLGESLVGGAISLVFASMLYFVGLGIPVIWRPVLVAMLPLLSAFLYSMKTSDPFETFPLGTADNSRLDSGMIPRLVVAAALIAFTAGVGRGVSTLTLADPLAFSNEGSICIFCICLIAILILYGVNRYGAAAAASKAYTALMVMGIGLMLATCFGFPIGFLTIGKETLWLMVTVIVAYLTFRYEISAVRVFGFSQVAYFAGSIAGWVVGHAIAPYYYEQTVYVSCGIVLAMIVVIVLVYVLPEERIRTIVVLSGDDVAADVPLVGSVARLAGEGLPATPEAGASAAGIAREGAGEGDVGVAGTASAAGVAGRGADAGRASATGAGGSAGADALANAAGSGTGGTSEGAAGEGSAAAARGGASLAGGVGGAAGAAVKPQPSYPPEYGPAADPRYGLSARELQIMALFAQGRSANWIAEHLVISKNTVRTHLRSVYTKLGVHSRQELLNFIGGEDADAQ